MQGRGMKEKLYFIGFTYFGSFGDHPQYHVAKKPRDYFITACAINTIMRKEGPEMVREKEPPRGGKWTICPMCKKQWKKKTGEFKYRKVKRTTDAIG